MSKKLLLIAAAGVLFVGGMGAGFYVLWSKISSLETAAHASTPGGEVEAEEEDKVRPVFHLDSMIVNLADGDGRRYLRTTMEAELVDDSVSQQITERLPQIKDTILKITSTRRFEDICSIEGKNALRDEIVATLNGILKKESITNLYFTEFVVQ